MKRTNIFSAEFGYDDDPEPYRAGYARLGPLIGAQRLGATAYELPPGQSICPYHYEYGEEEWLLVLDGQPTLRHPDGEDVLDPGDLVAFRSGPEGAHKVTNGTGTTVRVLMLSTVSSPCIVVYPDSDKILASPGNDADRVMVRRSANLPGAAGYYDGELPPAH